MSPWRKLIFWLPPLLWAGVIFRLSAQSYPPTVGPEFPLKDKVGHLGLYVILAGLILRPLRHAHELSLPKTALVAMLLTSAYGASDEFHQRFVPHRTCDVWDWTSDSCGGLVAATAYCAYESHRNKKTNR